MDISVVIPVYNEEGALPAFYHALADALDRLPKPAEIVFANDGRPTDRPTGSTRSPRPIQGFACSICHAITGRPPP